MAYLSIPEAAARIGCSTSQMRCILKRGEIAYHRNSDGQSARIHIDPVALDGWLEARRARARLTGDTNHEALTIQKTVRGIAARVKQIGT